MMVFLNILLKETLIFQFSYPGLSEAWAACHTRLQKYRCTIWLDQDLTVSWFSSLLEPLQITCADIGYQWLGTLGECLIICTTLFSEWGCWKCFIWFYISILSQGLPNASKSHSSIVQLCNITYWSVNKENLIALNVYWHQMTTLIIPRKKD